MSSNSLLHVSSVSDAAADSSAVAWVHVIVNISWDIHICNNNNKTCNRCLILGVFVFVLLELFFVRTCIGEWKFGSAELT